MITLTLCADKKIGHESVLCLFFVCSQPPTLPPLQKQLTKWGTNANDRHKHCDRNEPTCEPCCLSLSRAPLTGARPNCLFSELGAVWTVNERQHCFLRPYKPSDKGRTSFQTSHDDQFEAHAAVEGERVVLSPTLRASIAAERSPGRRFLWSEDFFPFSPPAFLFRVFNHSRRDRH